MLQATNYTDTRKMEENYGFNEAGTSFHGHKVNTTVATLKEKIGEPAYEDNHGHDKSNFDWVLLIRDGYTYFPATIYDWKKYRALGDDETVDFHIGAKSNAESIRAQIAITERLK